MHAPAYSREAVRSPKARAFWPLAGVVLLTDCTTKQVAVAHLDGSYVSHDALGSLVRFTLVRNPGIAFGIDVSAVAGEWTRLLLTLSTMLLVCMAFALYARLAPTARTAAAALALIVGGALGNAMDRLRDPAGVIDFLDLGVGMSRFFVCNVADIGITVGSLMLMWLLAPARAADPMRQ